ncbi:GDP-mannose-dependent alpha-(1-6)-phosphatidylinositol monomannoside mannosyltransferase [Rubripirellula tenax]|uniref:GDP-mannose-dependent alpha-(1-6)-phosphatidylinositol monomannoside mannosyltransferase n=1 Tax=Rubripirellula tenax TaxID=2528015 RepID=A0A5C6FEE0_9BACT|nr:glycosyltransferase [Rubripirellula tenax]TWU60176.1 GDP-mannose-dependent alpha-(1-6)-phosphatidylinositol monomannoside mannosyltransferase [Rubripirellula tenax]
MKVALAHHWLNGYRGGEKVLEQMASLFPASDVYTLVHDPTVDVPGLRGHKVHASRLNRFPKIQSTYRHLLPLHPWAISGMRVPDDVDLLLSSDASLIKGIPKGPSTKHVCYCHSPPRYLWELGSDYKRASFAARIALDRFAQSLREFDRKSSESVDDFVANSKFVAGRIKKYYDRESTVIYPPVATDDFVPDRPRGDFHLVISELVSYKRIDIAVDAYNRTGKRLVVIGGGPEKKALEASAKQNIEFLGRQPFSSLKEHFETCEAFVFPGIEDFGITPVEAQASGAPVIALRAGGALETVIDNQTGLFFDEQTPDSLIDAIERFDPSSFDWRTCRSNAENFSSANFLKQYNDHVQDMFRQPHE